MSRYFNLYMLQSQEAFHDALVNLAINSPDDFQKLMQDIPNLVGYNPRDNPFSSLYDRISHYGITEGYSKVVPVSDEEAMGRFAERSAKQRAKDFLDRDRRWEYHVPQLSPELEETIRHLQRSRAAEAIIFLLERAMPDVQKSFLNNFLSLDELARRAQVKVIVRRNERPPRGNLGRYLIYTRKENEEEELLLRFTHQASCVFYMMYLIDRYQRGGFLQPLDLATNRREFMSLYSRVYDINASSLEQRLQNLLYREENGRIRVGRQRELIYDIRMHVEEHFVAYDEAAAPYVMTAYRHLEIDAEHIVFEDDDLLDISFIS